MAEAGRLAVIQSFRDHTVPVWIARCLDSVRSWAERRGHAYFLWGDEFYDLCGAEYLSRGVKNPRAITNYARLLATRDYLKQGFAAVVWLDADVFVFDPEGLDLNFPPGRFALGYAFGREVWMQDSKALSVPRAHNALTYFTPSAKDLDFLIEAIRHIDAGREITSNFQVGVRLLQGLHYSLGFELLPHVGLFSPRLITAIERNDAGTLKRYGHVFGEPSQAANLCLSLTKPQGEKQMLAVMDVLERSRGEVVNRFAGVPASLFEKARWRIGPAITHHATAANLARLVRGR